MLKKALETNSSQLKDLSEPNFNQKALRSKIERLEAEIAKERKMAIASDYGVDVEALRRKIILLESYRARLESLRLMNDNL